jgi:hypothetical protein
MLLTTRSQSVPWLPVLTDNLLTHNNGFIALQGQALFFLKFRAGLPIEV